MKQNAFHSDGGMLLGLELTSISCHSVSGSMRHLMGTVGSGGSLLGFPAIFKMDTRYRSGVADALAEKIEEAYGGHPLCAARDIAGRIADIAEAMWSEMLAEMRRLQDQYDEGATGEWASGFSGYWSRERHLWITLVAAQYERDRVFMGAMRETIQRLAADATMPEPINPGEFYQWRRFARQRLKSDGYMLVVKSGIMERHLWPWLYMLRTGTY